MTRRDAVLSLWQCLAIALLALALAGCARGQLELIADLRAAAQAHQAETDPAKRDTIATGVMAGILAALDKWEGLPQPARTPAEIRADPAGFADGMLAAQADPPADEPKQGPPAPPPGVLDRLRSAGDWLLTTGLMIAGVGGIVWLIFAVTGWLKWAPTGLIGLAWGFLRWIGLPVAQVGAWWGAASAGIGAALVWLADWWWAVAIVAAVCIGGVTWWQWRKVCAWLGIQRKTPVDSTT